MREKKRDIVSPREKALITLQPTSAGSRCYPRVSLRDVWASSGVSYGSFVSPVPPGTRTPSASYAVRHRSACPPTFCSRRSQSRAKSQDQKPNSVETQDICQCNTYTLPCETVGNVAVYFDRWSIPHLPTRLYSRRRFPDRARGWSPLRVVLSSSARPLTRIKLHRRDFRALDYAASISLKEFNYQLE